MIETLPRDPQGAQIMIGSVVTVVGEGFTLQNRAGLVLDLESKENPENGPIAVFFDREVENYRFDIGFSVTEKWDGKRPTLENYRDCPRVCYFRAEELRVELEFGTKTMADRMFGNMGWHQVYSLPFRLERGTHACQLEACRSGKLATERSFVNLCGAVCEVYTCTDCHPRANGMRTESLDLKHPLPGPKDFLAKTA